MMIVDDTIDISPEEILSFLKKTRKSLQPKQPMRCPIARFMQSHGYKYAFVGLYKMYPEDNPDKFSSGLQIPSWMVLWQKKMLALTKEVDDVISRKDLYACFNEAVAESKLS